MPDNDNHEIESAEHCGPSATLPANLNEDSALALLSSHDVTSETLHQISKNGQLLKSRKLKLALGSHPRTPRHVSLPILRQLFTFDLMQVALIPAAPADVKKAAEEVLVSRLESLSLGEKLSLARRASGRVAGALLADGELRVIDAILENPHLTEAAITRAILRDDSPAQLCNAVCRHSKWSLRREVRVALLRSAGTPQEYALRFARALPPVLLAEILQSSKLPESLKSLISDECLASRSHPSQ